MKFCQICGLVTVLSILCVNSAVSGPILKPRKYYGPIPRSSLSLRIGFHGGATNEEMWNKLDALVDEKSGQAFTEDFGNAFTIDGTYTYKLHPQFAVRANGSLTLFRSDSNGYFVPTMQDTAALLPVYDFSREFNVDLLVVEGSGVYYFTDAGINEFQPYIGAGFNAGVPHAIYKTGLVNRDTKEIVSDVNDSEWSLEAGVHGLLGALYYVRNTLAFNVEAKYQIVQSKFPVVIETPDGLQRVRFDVDYTGFILNFGAVWAF